MTAPHPDGEGAADAINHALIDAAVSPDQVDFVNAHGTGTPQNDMSESRALHRVFGERTSSIPVTSNKAAFGHLLGSSGAIEAVSTILSMMHGVIHPMPDVGQPDSELDLDIVVGAPRSIPADAVSVSSSFAFGGSNAAVVLRGWNQGANG
jgi:3-oxoacyl-[acyl-carrier-protein] synthase II